MALGEPILAVDGNDADLSLLGEAVGLELLLALLALDHQRGMAVVEFLILQQALDEGGLACVQKARKQEYRDIFHSLHPEQFLEGVLL